MSTTSLATSAPRSTLKPYLSLWHLISLAPLASPIISLIFIAFRISASSTSAQDRVADAKDTLAASCLAAEHAATVGASLPRFLAERANAQITDAVRATMEGSRIALTLSLTAVQGIIEFIIDIWRSTLLCFIELAIRGGLSVLIAAVSEITGFLNNTLASITSGIASDVQKANSAIKAVVDGINAIPLVPDITAPQFTVPSADQLANIKIPTDFEDKLKALNNTIPTLDDIREKIDQVLGIPFNLLKKEINDTFITAQQNFVATPLPVPEESTITFCGDLNISVIDDLSKDIGGLARTGMFILVGVIVILIIAYTAIQWYSQRSLLITLQRARDQWFTDHTVYHSEKTVTQRWEPTDDNLLTMHAYIEHPLWSRIVYALSGRFNWSRETTNALGWFGAYVFHPAAMMCLMIGVFGIISIELQLLAARPLQAHYSAQVATAVGDFSNTIATNINATMAADSKRYADELNARVDAAQTTINEDLFGWVNGTTTGLNSTLAAFYEDIQDAVDKVFGNTVLDAPAQEFLRCILGSKITAIENALTFLHDNLVISIPRVQDDALMLSQGRVDEVVKPISAAAVGSGNSDGDEGVVGKIVNAYIKSLEKERITFIVFLLLWLAVVLVACAVVAWHLWGQRVWFKFKQRRWQKKARPFHDGLTPWRAPESRQSAASSFHSGHRDGKVTPDNLPSFAPLQEPTKRSLSPFGGRNQQDNLRQRRPSNPNMSRTWDDMLDSREKQREAANGGKLATLMALGKRATRVGKSSDPTLPIVNYGNLPPPPPVPAASGNDSDDNSSVWIKRLTFWKKPDGPETTLGVTVPHSRNGSLDEGYDFGVAPPRRHRTKPSLTIDTERASNAPGLTAPMPIVENTASPPSPTPSKGASTITRGLSVTSAVPSTAKSGHVWDMVVPAAPVPPLPVADPKKLVISPPMPLQPRKPTLPSKPNQYLPFKLDPRMMRSGETFIPSASASTTSVQSSNKSAPAKAPALPSMNSTIMPIPLHHNFPTSITPAPAPAAISASNRSPYRTAELIRPEQNRHQRTPSAARLLTPLQTDREPQPARHSSIAIDPFADPRSAPSANPFSTPFDDSNAVHNSSSKPRQSPSPPGLSPFRTPPPGTPGKAL